MKRIPVYIQLRNNEIVVTILRMVLAFYGCFPTMEEIRETCISVRTGSITERLTRSAELLGLKVEEIHEDGEALFKRYSTSDSSLVPVMKGQHMCILNGVHKNSVRVNDTQKGSVSRKKEKFLQEYSGTCMVIAPAENFVRRGRETSYIRKLYERISGYSSSVVKLTALHVTGIATQILMTVIICRILDLDEASGGQWPLVILMFALLVVESSTLVIETIISRRYSMDAVRNSGHRMFRKILDLPFRIYEHFSTGDLMDRMDTNTTLDDTILRVWIPFSTDAASVMVYFLLLFHYNRVMAFICLGIEIIYLLLSVLLQKHIAVLSNSISVSSANLSVVTLRGFDTISTTKSTGAENTFFGMWRNHEMAYLGAREKIQQVTELNKFLGTCHDVLIDGVILFVGAIFILQGQFTLGMMTSIQSVIRHIENKLRSATFASDQLNQCVGELEKSRDLLDLPSLSKHNNGKSGEIVTGDIVAEELTFAYPGESSLALDHVSFRIREGQLVALVGHTGCGKSTLLKILQGIYQPDSGRVTYGNLTREEISDRAFHDSIVTVNQEISIFSDTIRNNMTMWDDRITDDALHAAAVEVDIYDRIMTDASGYDFVMDNKGSSFSGGELQRMEFAGTLAKNPTFLLLDEFTSAQDAIREARAMEILRKRGITCIMTAHRISTVIKADWIIVMDNGKIVEQGTHDELYQSGNFYRKLIDMGK